MERHAPIGAISQSIWPVAAASAALHAALVIALMAVSLPPRSPDTTSLVVDVVLVSWAPLSGDAIDQAGNGDIADVASPPPLPDPADPKQAPEKARRSAKTSTASISAVEQTPPPEATPAPEAQEPDAFIKPPAPVTKRPRTEKNRAVRAGKAERLAALLNKVMRPPGKATKPTRRGSNPRGRRIAATFRLGSANNPTPRYPRFARIRGWEGRVVLLVDVDREGTPGMVKIETSSGFASLDKAAIRAVKRWRFQPARLTGMSIADTVRVPIRFELVSG